jgi:Holliday junction resolvase
MVHSYRKGYAAELELVHKLAEKGFMVIRTPRSGRINLASPDVIAAKSGKILVIECKSRASAFKVESEQLDELRQWQEKAGAVPYIGWKISRKGWIFLNLDDVAENHGNIGKKFALEKGMPLEHILESAGEN